MSSAGAPGRKYAGIFIIRLIRENSFLSSTNKLWFGGGGANAPSHPTDYATVCLYICKLSLGFKLKLSIISVVNFEVSAIIM
jgi:hypothetical protein